MGSKLVKGAEHGLLLHPVADPSYTFYMGKHKDENEDLIRYMWPEDVWFHVDNHSSAHVYLRLKAGQTLDDIPKQVLIECCQLTKQNSIKASKLDDITIIYTMHSNLKKTNHMVAGEVGFHDEKAVRKHKVPSKNGPLLRKLEKTKREEFPDLRKALEDRNEEEERRRNQERKESRKTEAQQKKELRLKAREEQAQREYRDIFNNEEAKEEAKAELKSMTVDEY